jgi:Carboxypeptidase regulatory-like domain
MLTNKTRLPVGLLLALFLAGTASAQSSVANISGDAKAGDKVMIFNPETGLKREIEMDKDGRYRARSLPIGNYSVTITHADGSIGKSHAVSLRVGATAFVPADATEEPAAAATGASQATPDKT